MPNQLKLHNDRFRRTRGGHARFLALYCEHCKEPIFIYQKDGPGTLKRLYLDRIVAPAEFLKLREKPFSKLAKLFCGQCGTLIGVPMIYEKENRPAYRLFTRAVGKKIVKFDCIR